MPHYNPLVPAMSFAICKTSESLDHIACIITLKMTMICSPGDKVVTDKVILQFTSDVEVQKIKKHHQ